MPNINGEWIMRGCARNSADRIRTAAQAADYINETGFLPLFANEIPGFSLEEHTVAEDWWTGDPENDPWEWRCSLAAGGKLAYGKFFCRKAGFISLRCLPDFVNYRRDGYDFDALWDDGKAKLCEKQVMDSFQRQPEQFSPALKNELGWTKEKSGRFDAVLASLQQKTYLCIRDLRRRVNKAGRPFGWHVAVYAAPEHLWGEDFVTSAYSKKPVQSAQTLMQTLMTAFPDASPEDACEILK